MTFYELPAPRAPFKSWGYGVRPGKTPLEAALQLQFDQPRYCIAPATVERFFGRAQNDSMNGDLRQLAFEVRTRGRYTAAVFARFTRAPACMQLMQIKVGYPQ